MAGRAAAVASRAADAGAPAAATQGAAPSGPARARFDALVGQATQARQTLADWHHHIAQFEQAHGRVLQPLQAEHAAARRDFAFALDGLFHHPGWTRAEAQTLHELIATIARDLLRAGRDDSALQGLLSVHGGADDAAAAAAQPGPDTANAAPDEGTEQEPGAAGRRHAAQRAARAARAAKARPAAATAQPVRDVYRRLASALHPDREPDATARQAKTVLMQQANQAYAAGDLLALLALQRHAEVPGPGAAAAATAGTGADTGTHPGTHPGKGKGTPRPASEERLHPYNQLLAAQLAHLRQQIDHTAAGFCDRWGLGPAWGLAPDRLPGLIDAAARRLRALLVRQQQQQRLLSHPTATRQWLKAQRHRMRQEGRDDALF